MSRPPARPGIAEYFAWGVILAAIAATTLLHTLGLRSSASKPAQSNALQLQMSARMTLGVRELTGLLARFSKQQVPVDLEQYLKSAREQAATPADHLRVAILEAEIKPQFDSREAIAKAVDRPDATDEHRADAQALKQLYREGPQSLPGAERQRLLQRYGWFAELALVHGRADTDASRRDLLASTLRSTVGVLLVYMVLLIAFIAGVALLIIAVARFVSGKLRLRYDPWAGTAQTAQVRSFFLEAFAIYLAGMIGFSLLMTWLLPVRSLQVSWLLLPMIALALCWPRIRGASWTEVRHALGLHAGDGVLKELAMGATAIIAALPVLVVGMIISALLMRFSGQTVSHPIVNEDRSGAWSIIGIYALACIFAPVTEELLFRGALFHHLRQRWGFLVSTFIVSIIFAALHPQGLLGIPMLTLIAFILAGIRQWRSSILAPMIAHAMINGTALTLLTVASG